MFHLNGYLRFDVLFAWIMYDPLTTDVFSTFLRFLQLIHIYQWCGISQNRILNVFLQYFEAVKRLNTLKLNLNLDRVMNWQFNQQLFHFLKIVFIIAIFHLLYPQDLFNGMIFSFGFLMVWPALTWVSSFDKWGHYGEYFPQFYVMLYCENMRKIIQKHNVFDMFFRRPMSRLVIITLRMSIINRNEFQHLLWTLNTP